MTIAECRMNSQTIRFAAVISESDNHVPCFIVEALFLIGHATKTILIVLQLGWLRSLFHFNADQIVKSIRLTVAAFMNNQIHNDIFPVQLLNRRVFSLVSSVVFDINDIVRKFGILDFTIKINRESCTDTSFAEIVANQIFFFFVESNDGVFDALPNGSLQINLRNIFNVAVQKSKLGIHEYLPYD